MVNVGVAVGLAASWGLARVAGVDYDESQITLEFPDKAWPAEKELQRPFVRRWDHTADKDAAGAVKLANGPWLELEDGIQVQFEGGPYRAGDYWLIPARTATGDVEWPGPVGQPMPQPPQGITRYYAPLAIVTVDASSKVTIENDLRRTFAALAI